MIQFFNVIFSSFYLFYYAYIKYLCLNSQNYIIYSFNLNSKFTFFNLPINNHLYHLQIYFSFLYLMVSYAIFCILLFHKQWRPLHLRIIVFPIFFKLHSIESWVSLLSQSPCIKARPDDKFCLIGYELNWCLTSRKNNLISNV